MTISPFMFFGFLHYFGIFSSRSDFIIFHVNKELIAATKIQDMIAIKIPTVKWYNAIRIKMNKHMNDAIEIFHRKVPKRLIL